MAKHKSITKKDLPEIVLRSVVEGPLYKPAKLGRAKRKKIEELPPSEQWKWIIKLPDKI